MNASTRARYSSSIVNQNQGGGSKKAGFPYQVGRSTWSSVTFKTTSPTDGKCCKLAKMQMNLFPLAKASRPIGSTAMPNTYFHIPGTGH